MNEFLGFIQEIFMLKKDDSIKVGLTQFRKPSVTPIKKQPSINNKDVKLSDLMRRVS